MEVTDDELENLPDWERKLYDSRISKFLFNITICVTSIAFVSSILEPFFKFVWNTLGFTISVTIGTVFVLLSGILLFFIRESKRGLYATLEMALGLYIGGFVIFGCYQEHVQKSSYLHTIHMQDFAPLWSKIIGAVYFLVRGFDNWIKSEEERAKTEGYSKLMMSAYRGWNWLISYQLKHGEKVDATNQFGTTALMVAVKQNKSSTVKLLLDKGADITRTNTSGDDAVKWAEKNENPTICNLLREHRKKS